MNSRVGLAISIVGPVNFIVRVVDWPSPDEIRAYKQRIRDDTARYGKSRGNETADERDAKLSTARDYAMLGRLLAISSDTVGARRAYAACVVNLKIVEAGEGSPVAEEMLNRCQRELSPR